VTVLAARLAAFLSHGSGAAQFAPVYFRHEQSRTCSRPSRRGGYPCHPKEASDVKLRRQAVAVLVALPVILAACSPTSAPASPSMDPSMPGMDMGGSSSPSASPAAAGGMPGMGGSLMVDQPVPTDGAVPATATTGLQPLPFTLDGQTKVFQLTAKPVFWKINGDTQVTALTYNGTVPGPLIRVTEGDRVRVVFTNKLTTPTSVHWHGQFVPSNMDGVAQPELSQKPVMPGGTFTYEFEAKPAGTFMYHSHVDTDSQINVGLFGGLIVDPKNWAQVKPDVDETLILNEWRVIDGVTYPAMPSMGEPNFFTINGKTYPDIPTINVKKGQRVRLRFVGAGQFGHPMHLHGSGFKIVATDGFPVPTAAQLTKDTIPVHPGERFDVEFVANNPGRWALHCHVVHHTTNNDVEPGGLLMVVNVEP
jgi:FtsP/CotA-like multicopper oxidase with cupredoxin domain